MNIPAPDAKRVPNDRGGRPLLEPSNRKEWRDWLERNAGSSTGVWLAIGKKGNPVTSLSYDDAVEEALAFGWIDSLTKRLDEHRFLQVFTPRRPNSVWSATNKARVERLTAEGLMTEAGLRAVEVAKVNGSWSSFDDVEAMIIPDDLAEGLASTAGAREGFEKMSASDRKMVLYWVASAKRPETRSNRIAQAAAAAVESRMPR